MEIIVVWSVVAQWSTSIRSAKVKDKRYWRLFARVVGHENMMGLERVGIERCGCTHVGRNESY